ncbi:MAG: ABC transporter permease [Oscillospiraceae bacterium]|nr:ABC transporter permease [Oscillospiraceae bacterium]
MTDKKAATLKKEGSLWSRFMSLNGSAVFIAMLIIMVIFEIYLHIVKGESGLLFISGSNIMSILRQQAYVGIIAFGLTLVMITGNIDLSVGSMLTFMCCVCAKIMMTTDNGLLGIFGTIAIGAICGLVNGVLVSYVKLNSFITTLGTSSIFTALALRLSSGTVLVIPDNCDPLFQAVGVSSFGPIHILIVWFVVVALILGFILSRTVFGQQLYTIGANPTAARFSGIRCKRNTTAAYIITGICVGLAAVLMMANVKSSNPQASNGKEMDIILAIVLGGVAISGGKGSVWGTIIGVLFSGVLTAGFTQMNMSTYLQWVIMGIIMVFALSLDVMKEKGVTLWKKK